MVKQSLQIPIVDELYNVNSGQNSFYSNLMSEYFNLYDFNYNSLSGNIKQRFFGTRRFSTQTKFLSLHQTELQPFCLPRFNTTKIFEKSSRKTQNRLPQPTCWIGRYDKGPLDERIFALCRANKTEDETHLLLDWISSF